ncbi:MAG: tetratricopeptide repeat protein [Cytophagales bacterium]
MIKFFLFLLFINLPSESKLKKAIKKYEKGKYKKVIDILKTKNKSKNYDHYFYLGHSYSFVGKNELSILYYDTAINLNNQKDIAFFERGISYFLSGNSRKALDDINTAILINSENANYLINRGTIYYDLGMIDSACNDWQNAINMDNDVIDYSIIEINCN